MQVGNQLFRGSLEPIQGTAVCFEEVKTSATDNNNDSSSYKSLSFTSKTDKVLVMKRVFLQPKSTRTSDDPGPSATE